MFFCDKSPRVGFVKLRATFVTLIWLMAGLNTVFAGPKTWKTAGTGYWTSEVNWSEGSIPAAGDDVYITNSSSANVILDVASSNLNSIVVSTRQSQVLALL